MADVPPPPQGGPPAGAGAPQGQQAAMQLMVANAVQAAVAALQQQHQAAITALQQQQAQQQQLLQQQQQQQQQPGAAFAVNPGGNGNLPWDFQSSAGIKLYSCATAPFDPLYDGEEDKLNAFLRKIKGRAKIYGFDIVLMVPDANGNVRDLTREHGCLTINDVKNAAIVYLSQQQRAHQASSVLGTLMTNSMTPRLIDRLYHRKQDYLVNIPGQADPKEDGPCMLLSLIQLVNVDTIAAVNMIMAELNDMRKLMDGAKSDVAAFNAKVEELVDALNAREATVPNLIPQLFSGYKACDDTDFTRYMKFKEDMYLDRSLHMTEEELMRSALERFKTIGADWGKKSEAELEFIAMQSELKQLRQNAVRKAPQKAHEKEKRGTADPNDKGNRNTGKFAWKGVAPKSGEAHEKTVNGKVYIYCPHHGDTKWVLKINLKGIEHKTGCRKMAEASQAAGGDANQRLTAAVANIEEMEHDDDENI